MRKIVSVHEMGKKKRRNQLIVGVVLIGVMMFGTLGYAFQGLGGSNTDNEEGIVKYNGYSFAESGEYWSLAVGDFNFLFKYNPEEIEEIGEEDFGLITKYTGKPLYIYSEDNLVRIEILRNLQYFPQRVQNACPKNKICEDDVPIKDCEDNFIIIEKSELPELKSEGNCTFIKGSGEEIIKAGDEFLFKILGII